MSGWAYYCSQRGYHQRNGVSAGTATVVWSDYCAICGAWIGRPRAVYPTAYAAWTAGTYRETAAS